MFKNYIRISILHSFTSHGQCFIEISYEIMVLEINKKTQISKDFNDTILKT
jgi:hypothetical protein